MDRIRKLTVQLSGCPFHQDDANEGRCPFGHESQIKPLQVAAQTSAQDVKDAAQPPTVPATKQTSEDPINFLLQTANKYPEIFMVDRGNGHKYAVLSDVDMFEDVLTYDDEFGNPVTPNMSVNKTIFQIPEEQLARHEQNAIGGLRKYLINHNAELADIIGAKLPAYFKQVLGESGEMDLRDFGQVIFWPMTQALFGDRANLNDSPFLFEAFEDIDNYFGKALRGHKVPQVEQGVTKAYTLFSQMVHDDQKGGPAIGPVTRFYDDVTNHEDPTLTAKLSTAAFWGSMGNSVPSTVWAFGLVLANAEARAKAYAEVDGAFADQPDASGHFDYSKLQYLTAALKETLRLKTYSIAWRQAQSDTVLTSKKGNKYLLPKGTLVGVHFALRHHDPRVHENPESFRPERFLGSGAGLSPTVNGHKYAWVPFSAGRHKCSGYSLAMLEIPLIMALVFREYDMKLIDPLPGMDFKQAFGVIGPDSKPVRVRYQKRTSS